jgi:endonuclease YncB( thermonuclease family)
MAATFSAPAFGQDCAPDPKAEAIFVRAIPEPLTLALADGSLVRLADIDVPPFPPENPTAARAHDFLAASVVGRPVRLRLATPPVDRYGRLRAYAFVDRSADVQGLDGAVQQAMLLHGIARLGARVEDVVCTAGLRAVERKARLAGTGLWSDPQYSVKRADEPAALRRLRGHLVLVEGRVLSVRESGGTVYLNFGRRWSEDFTVTVARRNLKRLAAGGVVPKQLERRTVLVRGWLEERGGPWIELTRPEQIEVVGN